MKNLNRRLSTFNLRDKLKPSMIPVLLPGLSDPDGEVRTELLLAIAKLAHALPVPTTDFEDGEDPPRPSPEELERLETALQLKVQATRSILTLINDRDPGVRWNAAALLGALGVEAKLVVPALTRMLRTETTPLTQNDRTIGLAPLASHYSDVGMYWLPSGWPELLELRLSAIGALGRLKAGSVEAVPELVAILRTEKDMRTRWFIASALHEIGPSAGAAVPTLIELLRSREVVELPPDKARGADNNHAMPLRPRPSRSGIGPPARGAVPDLVQSLADKDPKVRAEAASALGEIGGDAAQAIPRLVKLTSDETDDGVANQGVHALGKIGAKAVPALTARMKAGDPDLRIRFVTALGDVGPGAAVAIPDLARAAVDGDEEIRTAAVEALGFVGKGSAAVTVIPVLISALKDPDSKVRANAVRGLSGIGPKTERVVPALVAALGDSNGAVASDASFALSKIGLPALPSILALVADRDPELSGQAENILSELFPTDPDLRPSHEAKDQRLFRIKKARSVLLSALKSTSERVRDRVADLLADLGESIVPDLIVALGDGTPSLRAGAAQVLELIGPKARPAVDALHRCLNDPRRRAAAPQILRPGDRRSGAAVVELLGFGTSPVQRE